MKKRKVLGMVTALALTAVVCIGGTLAYLSAQSEMVNNTFTVGTGYEEYDGSVGIRLDEAKVMETGEVSTEERATGNQEYPDLMPGDTKKKDPTVYFVAGSVESYVFVKVEGTVKAAENHLTVEGWNTTNWKKIYELDGKTKATTETGDGYYVFKGTGTQEYILDLSDQAVGLVKLATVFEGIKVEDMNNDQFAALKGDFNDTAIKVSACAVQAAEGATMESAFAQATFK